jgi:hypothetical protein
MKERETHLSKLNPFVSGIKNHTKKNIEKQKDPKTKYVPYPFLPTVTSIWGTACATTKLNSHCVDAASATFKARKRAVGISDTIIQQQGPHPNWKKAAKRKMQVRAK